MIPRPTVIRQIAAIIATRYCPACHSAEITRLRSGKSRWPVTLYKNTMPSRNRPEPIRLKIIYRTEASVVRPTWRIIKIPHEAMVEISTNT